MEFRIVETQARKFKVQARCWQSWPFWWQIGRTYERPEQAAHARIRLEDKLARMRRSVQIKRVVPRDEANVKFLESLADRPEQQAALCVVMERAARVMQAENARR